MIAEESIMLNSSGISFEYENIERPVRVNIHTFLSLFSENLVRSCSPLTGIIMSRLKAIAAKQEVRNGASFLMSVRSMAYTGGGI